MANPNTEIWGAPETWIYSPNTTLGLTSELSQTLNADRPKVAYFGAGTTAGYEGSLLRAINVSQKMTLNELIDNSICPCGQAPDVSPFAKIAIFNENDDLSTTPRVVTINDNINWFFADKAVTAPYNNGFEYFKQYTRQGVTNEGLKYQQFAPKANSPASGANVDMQMCPYTYYGLRSLFLSIEVHCMPKTATNPITQTNWRTLKAWQLNYSTTEDIIGLRLYVRTCQYINATTHELTYSTDKAISGGQQSFVCVTNPITINNDGENTPTQLLSIYNKGNRCAYIFDITAQIFAWDNGNDSRTNRAVLPCWDYFSGQTVHTWYSVLSDATRYYYYKIPYSEETYNKIMSIAALFGCFFTDRNVNVFPYDMLTEYAYLPIIDENGVAHGEYTNGMANATNPLYTKNSIRDIDYNPDVPTDPNTYSVTTGFNTVGNVASTTKAYVVNGAALTGLSGEMWSILNTLVTTPDDMTNLDNLTLDAFLTNNPIDAIVSVKKFPLLSVPHAENLENIYLGKYQTGAAGYALAMQQARYNFEGIPIFPKFGDCFLDYSPYTKMQLYVPFCGTIDIDAADFMGRTLSVEMVIDFITGAVTAYVLANQLVVTSLTGNCGIDIAITGTEQSTVSAALENAILQDKSARGNYALKGSIGGMLTNPIGNITHPTSAMENRFTSKLQTIKSNYDLQHIEIPLRQIGSASPLNSWALEFVCRLIIYYPDGECITFNSVNEPSLITDKVQAFGNVNGFATVETTTLNNFTGYTEVSDADLTGISATDTEKEMILNLIRNGVYL